MYCSSTGRMAAYLGVNVKTLRGCGSRWVSQAGALCDWTPSPCMRKNHALAGSVLDRRFHEFRGQLQCKTTMRGGKVADRFAPSSTTWSSCGCVNPVVLGVDEWTCRECRTVHDPDANAAIDLEKPGSTRGDIAPRSASREARKAPWKSR